MSKSFPNLSGKKLRELDFKPWEKKIWAAYKTHEGHLKEVLNKGRNYDHLVKEQARIFKSKKSTPEVRREAGLRIIEYGASRDTYLELAKNIATSRDIDLRLLESESYVNLLFTMIDSLGKLAVTLAENLEGLDSELPQAFRQVRKDLKQLRSELSKTGEHAKTVGKDTEKVRVWYARYLKHKPKTGQDSMEEMFP